MASHAAADPDIPDLLTWARTHAGAPAGLAPVHRLDRATSGVLLCADDPELLAAIGAALAAGTVQKEYRALVYGRMRAGGTIRRPLADERRGRPLPASTRFRLLAAYSGASLLAVFPLTGRRHQIRRHLSAVGHPVVGDPRYGRRPGGPGRLWLHALRVQLPDGRCFEAPLPVELTAHLEALA